MRTKTVLSAGTFVLLAAAVLAACDRGGQVLGADGTFRKLEVPWLYHPVGEPDLDGLPDLVPDAATLSHSWTVRDEDFVAGQCSVEEGNIPTGTHRTLRFSVLIANRGTADLAVGDPLKHMDPNGDGDYSDSDNLFEFASCHHHFHFRNYAKYELLPILADGSLGQPVQARKRGFCMLDTTPTGGTDGIPPSSPYYRICGNTVYPGNQGISAGWGDEYASYLPGQLFVLDDAQEPVPPGRYMLRVTANPPFTQQNGEICPVTDSHGFCHMFAELSYDNNIGEVAIDIPDRVGKTGVGPGAGNFTEHLDPQHHPEATGNGNGGGN